jgi:hypothetical protein
MNSFVQFKRREDLEKFLGTPQVAAFDATGRLFKSSSQHVLILRELSPEDLSEIEALAQRHGGKVKHSVQYEPL